MAKAVERKGGCENIWGFVNGTFCPMSRPLHYQTQCHVYSGHKKLHGLNWQAITTPNGLISSFIGPYEGLTND
jgi:hypothetical protein